MQHVALSSFRVLFFSLCAFFASLPAYAGGGSGEDFNIAEMINHHIMDAHEWHLATVDGEHISIPLPVILYTDAGLDVFLSSKFHHANDSGAVVRPNGNVYKMEHEHIYYANEDGTFVMQGEEKAAPLDFSITKNVTSMLICALLMVLVFTSIASAYKKNKGKAPKGTQSLFEPIIVYLRDEVIIPNVGEKKYKKYLPYLLTLFFFIWFNNLLGLIPTGANASGNIAFTMTLAVLTLILTVFSGNSHYWRHILAMPGVPAWMYFILTPVELVGILTKPFALMMRLFANIMAGHTIILSLIGLTFVFSSYAVGVAASVFVFALFLLELFVALLQAYIFTLLTALFIGQAVEEAHH